MIQYAYADCVTFKRSREEFGGLSNMCGGYPMTLGTHHIRTVEHLYQPLRFPDNPKLQMELLAIPSPIIMKRVAYRYLPQTRSDWETVKSDIMAWCLELKLAHNFEQFSNLLRSTGNRDIVELSTKDDYWGAKPVPNGDQPPIFLKGWNTLGRLLWMMRRRLEINIPIDLRRAVIELPNFRFAGEDAIALAVA